MIEGEVTHALRDQFGDAVLETHAFRGDETVAVAAERIADVLRFCRRDLRFDFLTDLCGVHYPEREYAFEIVYHLYSFPANRRLRVKARIFRGTTCPTAVEVYPAADWLERETWDMLGIRFQGHPDLRRILMPEEFEGHPLRRDFPLTG